MKNLKKVLLSIALACVFTACEKEDSEMLSDEQQTINEITSHEQEPATDLESSLGYKSIKEMLNDGWEEVPNLNFDKEEDSNKEQPRNKVQSYIKEKLNFAHLKALGFDKYRIMHLMTTKYGSRPDGIAINNENIFDGMNPPITVRYNVPSYIHTGNPIISVVDPGDKRQKIIYDVTLENPSNVQDKHTIVHSIKKGSNSSWSVTESLSVALGGKVGLPLVTEGSIEITVGVSATQGGVSSREEVYEVRSEIIIPPKSKRRVIMTQPVSETKMEYRIPVYTSGGIGANFGHRVDGHYFRFTRINRLLDSDGRKEQRGFVYTKTAYRANVIAGVVEPLN
ncbi:ETX/MTX2 family pore-forming toxin [Aquimarina macrocephali]|uniref:ETX/MTX2 family pore-forming toxin n=1 Tax=Aquimarina macrocephali TaxID=666563 RepID=UPI000463F3D5|nr:ETX/MTX2 family pore-forming toxin [Aquimarina macrocephali]